ncbi:MAG TPA: tetratricopeptide repeat protein [Gammaproteobacteria bacterium]|nr:tetratricopeptide repeat protein [Gammaproteobacteria bacterium]
MSTESNRPERKDKKYAWKGKILVAETDIETGLQNPTKYCTKVDTQSTSLITRLEILNTTLREMLTNYWAWNKHYDPACVGRFIGYLMNKYKDILFAMPTGRATKVYPLVFSFIQQADDLLKRIPSKSLKPFDRTLGDSVATILNYLHDILKTDQFQSSDLANANSVFSLLESLRKHQLISQSGLSSSISWMGKFAEFGYFDAVPVDRVDSLFKKQEVTAEQAANYFNGITELAQCGLLNRRVSIESINFLLERIVSSANLSMIDVALDGLRKLIEIKRINNVDKLNLACVDRYCRDSLKSSEIKPKSSSASAVNVHVLLRTVNSLSHICRDIKRVGSYRSDLNMLSLEAILGIFATHKKTTAVVISKILISSGHIVQAQGQNSSERLKSLVKDLLSKINNPRSARWLHFDGIANALYGALISQVLEPTLTNELTEFFKSALKEQAQKPKSRLEQYHSYVNQVAQYIRHCKQPISEEMAILIKKRRPVVDENSFEYNLIEYVKTQYWFKKNQKIKDQFLCDMFYVDGQVDVLDENVGYIADIDGDIFHDKVKDKRRDQHLLSCYKEHGVETMGIIRIRINKFTTIAEAAEDWRIQYEARLKAYKQSKMTCASDSSDDSPREMKQVVSSSSDEEVVESASSDGSPREMKQVTTTSSDEEAIESVSSNDSPREMNQVATSSGDEEVIESVSSDDLPREMKHVSTSSSGEETTESVVFSIAMAQAFEQGKGVSKNPKMAFSIYSSLTESVSSESFLALFHMARCYEDGIGVKANPKAAINLLRLAAYQGVLEAQKKLAAYYEQGLYVNENFEEAFYFYSLAAKQGDPESMLNLAFYHLGGLVVERDICGGEKLLIAALKCKNPEVRSQFEDKVKDFLEDIENEIIKDTEKKGVYSFHIKDSSNDLISRLERLKKILVTKGKDLNIQVHTSLVTIFLKELKAGQQLQASNLIKVGQVGRWAKTPMQEESQIKEKIVIKDQSESKPLKDITNLLYKTMLEG